MTTAKKNPDTDPQVTPETADPQVTPETAEAVAISATYAVSFPAISLFVGEQKGKPTAEYVGIGDLPVVDGHVTVPRGHRVAAANDAAASVLSLAQSCGQVVIAR